MQSVLEKDIDSDSLKEAIRELEELKNQEINRLKELEEMNSKDTENFSKFCNNIGDIKREHRREKEREEERRNKFEANKSAYRKITNHINEGKITEDHISPLFRNDYPIYKFMDEKDMLDKPDDYLLYLGMYDELYPKSKEEEEKEKNQNKNEYIPHNIHYLSDEEQKKYLDMKDLSKNLIEEFMTNSCKDQPNQKKKYPSIDEILDKVGDDNDETFEGITFDNNNDNDNDIDTISVALSNSLKD
jgi:hypothetical protein